MKIIFLDIDGVLNHQLFYEKMRQSETYKEIEHPDCDLDPETIELLNGLLETTGAKVVISSTWRKGTTIEELQAILEKAGFKGEIIGKTPIGCNNCCRGDEIYRWIKDNDKLLGKPYYEFKEYVIFDDDSDMLLSQRANFIHIDSHCGLTPNSMYRAHFKLTGKYKN